MGKQVALTGATGFIGQALMRELSARGYSVLALSHDSASHTFLGSDPEALAQIDAVIHLAGESIDGRWSAEKKRRIYDSRILGTRALIASLAASRLKPRVFVCASACGFYGARGDEILTEASRCGDDFLARVVSDWEREAYAAAQLGIRTVTLRSGIVLGDGGALAKMAAAFRFGLGGPFGSGKQFVPWIHLDDIVALYIAAIETPNLSGPINAVAPDYATSSRFALALGHALARPAYIPAPAFALRAVLGEFAETILASQIVLPTIAQDAGFRWVHPNLEAAMIASVAAGSSRTSTVRRFEATQLIPTPIEKLFAFFSEAQHLESMTPPRLQFALRAFPPAMQRGATIAYRLRLHGIPIEWKTLISGWEPPYRFVDVQLHGPYTFWRHQHTFTPTRDGVVMRDTVDYVLALAPLGNVVAPLVDAEVRAIFDYRRTAIAKRFG